MFCNSNSLSVTPPDTFHLFLSVRLLPLTWEGVPAVVA